MHVGALYLYDKSAHIDRAMMFLCSYCKVLLHQNWLEKLLRANSLETRRLRMKNLFPRGAIAISLYLKKPSVGGMI